MKNEYETYGVGEDKEQQLLSERYSDLSGDRSDFLEWAEQCARLTIPTALSQDSNRVQGSLYINFKCYQGIGARGTLNLGSKLAVALFPIAQPFFKLQSELEDELIESIRIELSELFQRELSKKEAISTYDGIVNQLTLKIFRNFESTNFRSILNEIILQLLIAGNVLLFYNSETNKFKYYKLTEYVVRRDRYGNVLEIIIEEEVFYNELTDEIKNVCFDDKSDYDVEDDTPYSLYTGLTRRSAKDNFEFSQEINEIIIPSSTKTISKEDSPFLAVKADADTANYSSSFIYKYALTDLIYLDELQRAFLQIAAAMSTYKILVKEGSSSQKSVPDIEKKPNGEILIGDANDFSFLQLPVLPNAQFIQGQITQKTLELERIFLMNSGMQRDAERVTAYELQRMSQDLDTTLAGLYSYLGVALQEPISAIIMNNSNTSDIAKYGFKPTIIAGVGALGRTIEATSLQAFMSQIPPEMMNYINQTGYLNELAKLNSIDTERLLKTQQEVAQEQEQALRNQAALAATPRIADKGMQNE